MHSWRVCPFFLPQLGLLHVFSSEGCNRLADVGVEDVESDAQERLDDPRSSVVRAENENVSAAAV